MLRPTACQVVTPAPVPPGEFPLFSGVRVFDKDYKKCLADDERVVEALALAVETDVPNRPPVITSPPVTDGNVNTPYAYRVVATDAIREVMRALFTSELMPTLYTSSFEADSALREPPPRPLDRVIVGFREQTAAVTVGVHSLVERAAVEGVSMILEGAHLVPLDVSTATGPGGELDRALVFHAARQALVPKLAGWEAEQQARLADLAAHPSEFHPLPPTTLRAEGGATLAVQESGSVLAGGERPVKDMYVYEATLDCSDVTAIRLEVLAHDALPAKGPGRADHGSFVLSEISCAVRAGDADLFVAGGFESMSRVPMGSNVKNGPGRAIPKSYFGNYEFTTQFEGAERIAEKWKTPIVGAIGVFVYGGPSQKRSLTTREWPLAWHEDSLLSTPAQRRCAQESWKSHSVNSFAAAIVAASCSWSAGRATGDTPTAAMNAGATHGGFSGGTPTGGMSKMPEFGKIIATGNGSCGHANAQAA